MIQARLLRKNNPDLHYCNAFYSFLKEREIQCVLLWLVPMLNARSAVTRGKAVILGKNEVFKVGGHDFSRYHWLQMLYRSIIYHKWRKKVQNVINNLWENGILVRLVWKICLHKVVLHSEELLSWMRHWCPNLLLKDPLTPGIRKECESSDTFKMDFTESIRTPRELLEDILGNLTLKGVPYTILKPATEDDTDFLENALFEVDENFQTINSVNEIRRYPTVADFYEKHCTSRPYYFQVRKCNDRSCKHHKPIRGSSDVEVFPDPVTYDVDGILHTNLGVILQSGTSL